VGEEMSVPAGAEMLIGAPADAPPPELADAVREGAQDHPEVRTAYVFQLMILAEGEEPHLTLGLDLDEGADVVRISNDLAARAVAILPEGSPLDVYPLADDMLEAVAKTGDPVYTRD
jgi:hypothetical protein